MRVALITGGTGGIGLATARRFAQDGLVVAIADLDLTAAQHAADGLPGHGHMGIAMDVTDENAVVAGFEAVETRLGPIHVLGAFAGTVGNGPDGRQTTLTETTADLWDKIFAINARGTFFCIREYAAHRKAKPVEHGRIITVSSSGAQLGGYQSKSAYAASKGAVLSLTKAAARELASWGITVNAIAPGPIDTPMLRASRGPAPPPDTNYNALDLLPLGRIGTPEEVAAAAAYLASIEAAFVTGSTLDVNGGLRMQ
ncbi:SDR family oxidoreductase [Paraburkholderia sp. LEh10]|uniref:SDR family NAD(P)-dependent oxidoreductase n=1 Tax=Paraburkholderia sp. LEh10 TaxID=2821353 RepID=UPI001AEB2C82|nr:SDR family NAD(P)-dependent oxidoreductase [Paraburkholderia sp. LEh10]MBP0590468.1 SDR family oxidoreductase [Paraburkholderia sp. LEh10]